MRPRGVSVLSSFGAEFLAVATLATALRGLRRRNGDEGLVPALLRFMRSLVAVLRRPLAIRRWSRDLPTLHVTLSDDRVGDSIRWGLATHQPRPFRHRAVAAIALPATFEDYLRGRPRQAVRTNRHHAYESGLRVVCAASRAEAVDLVRQLTGRHRLHDAVATMARQLAERDFGQLWFVLDDRAVPVAFAAVAVDGDLAQLQTLQVALDIADRSSPRYLLSSEILGGLIAQSVAHLIVDSMLFSAAGVVYLEQRLGFAPVNVVLHEPSGRGPFGRNRRRGSARTADHPVIVDPELSAGVGR